MEFGYMRYSISSKKNNAYLLFREGLFGLLLMFGEISIKRRVLETVGGFLKFSNIAEF